MSLKELPSEDRLRLVRFICSFAWADLEVQDSERDFVVGLINQLDLEPHERERVDEWLLLPPDPEDVDPLDIPREHRQLFLNLALQMVSADGHIDEAEVETFALFEQLLR